MYIFTPSHIYIYLYTSTHTHTSAGQLLLQRRLALRQGLRLKGGLAPLQRRRVREFIEQHLETPLPLSQLAALCALSEYHFARMFQSSFGLPPHRYVLARRLARACQMLRQPAPALSEVALACGFASASHFSNRFRQALGATPMQYRAAFL